MKLARVQGTVVATAKHPAYRGRTLLVVQPLDEQGRDAGETGIAVDTVQAGVGDLVLVHQEGNGTRQVLGTGEVPIRSIVIGIVDELDVPPGRGR